MRNASLEVEIVDLHAGWATVIITTGKQRVEVQCSHVVDSLSDLLGGLAGLIESARKFEVEFTTENAGAYLLSLRRDGDALEVVAKRAVNDWDERHVEVGRQSRARLRWRGPFRAGVAAFVTPYARLWDELGAEEYEARWHHPFPEAALRKLQERRT
jgi:hypothetical protein